MKSTPLQQNLFQYKFPKIEIMKKLTHAFAEQLLFDQDPRHAVIFDGTSYSVVPAESLLDYVDDEVEVEDLYDDLDSAFDTMEELNETL
jgi:hypothetical protein